VSQWARRSGSGGSAAYQPDRGHFVHLNFTPQAGSEQAGNRPALILSPQTFNIATGLAFVCPVTNQGKGSPFEVPIPRGAKVTGYVLVSQTRSIDWIARNTQFHSLAPEEFVLDVLARLEAILQISLD
jgi:mRNA interferase MazF